MRIRNAVLFNKFECPPASTGGTEIFAPVTLTRLMSPFLSAFPLCLFLAASSVHGAVTANRPAYPAFHFVRAEAAVVAPGIQAKRDALMKQGAAALATGDTKTAATAFETAVSMVHAPDAELGLVRSYMQDGKYRQALSYGAHTAGAHKEEPEGTALYVWLLHLGGQEAAAKRILLEAQARMPGNALLDGVQRRIAAGTTSSSGKPDAARAFIPYSRPLLRAATAVLSGSGVLINGGRSALVILASVAHARYMWVRNGLGQLRQAAIENRFEKDGMALLKLDQPLSLTEEFMTASRDPFPGSVVYAIEYAMVRSAQPDWPVLRHGFLASPSGNSSDWELGITMPTGPHGGPVFDTSGALAGVTISGPQGKSMFLPISRMRRTLGDRLGLPTQVMTGDRMAMEKVYENAMRATVQVMTVR
ncbi:MAG: hypothetical protein ACJ8G3_27350 [Burkholderiaceae bacterium]